MTAPVGIAEIEETEGVELDAAVMVPRETRRCACRAVRQADQVRHDEAGCVPFALAGPVAADPYPAPEVTSRDEPSGAGPVPGAVASWTEKATEAGWRVKVQRSVGCLPHSTHGTPTRVRTLHAVIITKNGASAYAVHDGEKWASVVTWGTGAPWFAGAASITDFGQYIAADGRMSASWYAAIRARESGKVDKGKARAECNRGMHKGATLAAGRWTCPLCENSWGAKEAAWRKPKTTTKDTAR